MKTDEPITTAGAESGQLVNGDMLLKILFPTNCRPTLRWLRDQQKERRVPFRKVGHLVFFDPDEVRESWRQRNSVGAIRGGAA
jgi:hypothetical protein